MFDDQNTNHFHLARVQMNICLNQIDLLYAKRAVCCAFLTQTKEIISKYRLNFYSKKYCVLRQFVPMYTQIKTYNVAATQPYYHCMYQYIIVRLLTRPLKTETKASVTRKHSFSKKSFFLCYTLREHRGVPLS